MLADVKDIDNKRARDASERACLFAEQRVGAPKPAVPAQDFQRDGAVETLVESAVHYTHRAGAKDLPQPVVTDALAGPKPRRRRCRIARSPFREEERKDRPARLTGGDVRLHLTNRSRRPRSPRGDGIEDREKLFFTRAFVHRYAAPSPRRRRSARCSVQGLLALISYNLDALPAPMLRSKR